MKKKHFFNGAFWAGCINIPVIGYNLYFGNYWLIPISVGAMIICWGIAYKIAPMRERIDKFKKGLSESKPSKKQKEALRDWCKKYDGRKKPLSEKELEELMKIGNNELD